MQIHQNASRQDDDMNRSCRPTTSIPPSLRRYNILRSRRSKGASQNSLALVRAGTVTRPYGSPLPSPPRGEGVITTPTRRREYQHLQCEKYLWRITNSLARSGWIANPPERRRGVPCPPFVVIVGESTHRPTRGLFWGGGQGARGRRYDKNPQP